MNLNVCTVGGTLTRDPEVRHTASGTAVVNFAIAINKNWTDQNGVKQEKVTFVDIKFWGRQAEVIGEYFGKGGRICVMGELETESWEDQNGQKRSKQVINGRTFSFAGEARRDDSAPDKAAMAGASKAVDAAVEDDDGIPF